MIRNILYGVLGLFLASSCYNYNKNNNCLNARDLKTIVDNGNRINGDLVCLEGKIVGNSTKAPYSTLIVNSEGVSLRVRIDSDSLQTNGRKIQAYGRLIIDNDFVPEVDATRESSGIVYLLNAP